MPSQGRIHADRAMFEHRRRCAGRRLGLAILIAVMALAFAAGAARAYTVRGANGHLYGILPTPHARVMRAHASASGAPVMRYWGGSVMLSTSLHLIFWD